MITRILSYVYFLPYAWAFFVFWVLNFRDYPRLIVLVTGVVAVFVLYLLLMGWRGELASWHAAPLLTLWVVVRQEIWSSPAFKYRYEVPELPGGYATCSFMAAQASLFFSYLCVLSSLAWLVTFVSQRENRDRACHESCVPSPRKGGEDGSQSHGYRSQRLHGFGRG